MNEPNSGAFSLHLSNGHTLTLKSGSKLTASELPGLHSIPPGGPVALVSPHPTDSWIQGLQNLSQRSWRVRLPNGDSVEVKPGKNVRLAPGTWVNLGSIEGEIQLASSRYAAVGKSRAWVWTTVAIAALLCLSAAGAWYYQQRVAVERTRREQIAAEQVRAREEAQKREQELAAQAQKEKELAAKKAEEETARAQKLAAEEQKKNDEFAARRKAAEEAAAKQAEEEERARQLALEERKKNEDDLAAQKAAEEAAQEKQPTTEVKRKEESDHLIVPGRRIGSISLGMTASAVIKILGQPTRAFGSGAKQNYWWSTFELGVGVDNQSQRVVSVGTMGPQWATARGLRVGDSEAKVKAQLGVPRQTMWKGQRRWYPGLFIMLDKSGGKIIEIDVKDQ